MADKAVRWRTTCLRTERWDGGTKQAGRPAGEVNAGRSQSPDSTAHGRVEPWRPASEQKAH
ncbi:protein of unknown function (plasmid) [Cupriavidus taiwanensis]|uniref:Uncharacterized protein n=1 Tax=Cupriavidus taiwanensis TaxID=164546 RepID=A0A375HE14_9BURK|nr:protein of unknown function [Cupriavidus taiwanensis]SPA12759.1 hypothetical protein CBM2625_U40019 [Cupriavidus taiwanensis]SPD49098.1 protein of unknown function [Cupriavidus taiwanensis]